MAWLLTSLLVHAWMGVRERVCEVGMETWTRVRERVVVCVMVCVCVDMWVML